MVRRVVLAGAIVSLVGIIYANVTVHAGGTKSDSEVKVSASVTKPDAAGKQALTITLVHNKGWHSYANPVGNEDFDSNKTIVTVLAQGKPVDAKIDYPVGKVTKDKTVGDYKVYQDKVNIRATIQRARGDVSPLQVQVRIQACHEKGVCLLPATVKLTVP